MDSNPACLYKTLVVGVVILFVSLSVVTSTGILVDGISSYKQILNTVSISNEFLIDGKIAYACVVYPGSSGLPDGPCYFKLDDPGNITSFWGKDSPPFLSGGTWTIDGRWICCEYGSGNLYKIDPETGEMWSIGGGGISCNGLAWDPIHNRLYATDGSNLIEYNPDTGEQTLIGSHNQSGKIMIALAINLEGICYAWNILYNGGLSSLFTVNLETGEAIEVASMSKNLRYAQDGAFDWETGILYLAAYSLKGQLMTCDLETGELTLIGDFEGGAEIDALAIPYVLTACFNWTPTLPDPGETILFNASDSYDPDGFIILYEWDWNNDGVYDENHTNPTVTHSWSSYGYYPVTLKVTDNSSSTAIYKKTVRVGNKPPDPPDIDGPTGVPPGIYNYTFISTDPDKDDVRYNIDWGDGHKTGTWFINSGEEEIVSHNYSKRGNYRISACAVDI